MKPARLIGGGVDGDGLALRIVEAVHRVDVHHPADADEHDDQQEGDHEQTHQDAGRHEAHAVPGIAEDKVILVGGIEGSLQLQGLEAQGVVHVVDGRRVEGEVAAREGERGGGIHTGGAEVAAVVGQVAHAKVAAIIKNVKGDWLGGITCGQLNGELGRGGGGVGDLDSGDGNRVAVVEQGGVEHLKLVADVPHGTKDLFLVSYRYKVKSTYQ